MTKTGIFIFTRDRSDVFERTIGLLKNIKHAIFIIDDSIKEVNQLTNQKVAVENSYTYLGKNQFKEFIGKHNIEVASYSFLLREPGSKEWNLGYVRNFALLYSKAICLDRVLFMDDDIEVSDISLIDSLFELKNEYRFVGAHILGLVDDSVLGHIATDIGIFNERMLSGGFMVYNSFEIDHFFLNNYNEDWIWLFLQLKDKKYLQTGDVYQAISNPLENYKSKVIFQEFGEILLDGILDLYPASSYNQLIELEFWQRLLAERKKYLNTLFEISAKSRKESYVEITSYVLENSKLFEPVQFFNLFKKYFKDRDIFQSLYKSLA